MKTCQIHVRCTADEKERIKHLAKGNLSSFILSKILGQMIKEVPPVKECLEKNLLPSEIEDMKPRRCMKSHCKSNNGKLVMIHGLKAYLCDEHKDENVFA